MRYKSSYVFVFNLITIFWVFFFRIRHVYSYLYHYFLMILFYLVFFSYVLFVILWLFCVYSYISFIILQQNESGSPESLRWHIAISFSPLSFVSSKHFKPLLWNEPLNQFQLNYAYNIYEWKGVEIVKLMAPWSGVLLLMFGSNVYMVNKIIF